MYKLGFCGLVDTAETDYDDHFMSSDEATNTFTPSIISNNIYNEVILYQGEYNTLYIDNDEKSIYTDDEGNKLVVPQVWQRTTALFALFNENLNAGNTDFTTDNLDYILITRREATGSDNLVYDAVDIIYADDFIRNNGATLYDRFVQCNKEYDYRAIPVLTDGTEANTLIAKYKTDKKIKWVGHYIFDGVSEWHCGLDTSLEWTRKNNGTIIDGIVGKFPFSIDISENNYDMITIKGTHLKVDCGKNDDFDIDSTAEYNQLYDNFITNTRPKLIRDWTGRMWIAKLNGDVNHPVNNHYQYIQTEHNFVEIADAKDYAELYRYGFTNYNPSIMVNGNIAENVNNGATIIITVTDKQGDLYINAPVTLLLNNIEIWKQNTNSASQVTITNLDSGFYTIVVGSGKYATRKNFSINSSSNLTEPIPITVWGKIGG